MTENIIGWDIGGAHLKAAQVDNAGCVQQVILQPCPLWLGLQQLVDAVNSVLARLPATNAVHVLTMTGELVDLFKDRSEGVAQILAQMQALLPTEPLVFVGNQGFLPLTDIRSAHYAAIASANWLATAAYAARQLTQGLLVDIGSTTTDLVLFKQQQVQALGYSDYQRLQSGELVYTGIIRTAVMAVAQQAFVNGQQQGLMAEYFATMADVYRLTGELPEAQDHTETADGAEKTPLASARRLARMTGYDFVASDLALWQQFAQQLRQQQLQLIRAACVRQLSRQPLHAAACIVGAGVGRFLAKELALQLGYPYLDFAELLRAADAEQLAQASDCAPAVALAYLYRSELG